MLSEKESVKTITHRGLCHIFPQNSLESIESGLYKADYVQFDVLLTKDNKPIVFHDHNLNRLTNISQFAEFADRKHQDNEYDEKLVNDWWVRDFTLQELKKLDLKQPKQNRPFLKYAQFKIPTFEEVLLNFIQVKKRPRLPIPTSGLLIQIKSDKWNVYGERDQILTQKIAQLLKKYNLYTINQCLQSNTPIIIQSFTPEILQQLRKKSDFDIPMIYLISDDQIVTQSFLNGIRKRIVYQEQPNLQANPIDERVFGIGITQIHVEKNQETNMILNCQKMGLQIFYWTVMDDDYEANKIPFHLNNYNQVYQHLKKVGITGIITEFPERCRDIVGKYEHQRRKQTV